MNEIRLTVQANNILLYVSFHSQQAAYTIHF